MERRRSHERAVQVRPPPLLVDPQEVPARGAGLVHEADHRLHLSDVVPRDHRGHRRGKAGLDERPDARQDLLERPLAAHRIVGRRGGAVQAHLQAQPLRVLALQAFEHRALEEKAVGEDPQLATVNLGDALDQVEDVATEEGFAAREVEASDAELGRLVDQRPEPLGAHSLVAVVAARAAAFAAVGSA